MKSGRALLTDLLTPIEASILDKAPKNYIIKLKVLVQKISHELKTSYGLDQIEALPNNFYGCQTAYFILNNLYQNAQDVYKSIETPPFPLFEIYNEMRADAVLNWIGMPTLDVTTKDTNYRYGTEQYFNQEMMYFITHVTDIFSKRMRARPKESTLLSNAVKNLYLDRKSVV